MHKASKKWSVLLVALALFAVVAAACQAAPDTTTDGSAQDDEIATLQAQLDAANESGASDEQVAALQTQVAEAEAAAEEALAATDEPVEEVVDRNGGWFDTIVAVEEPNAAAAVSRLLAGDLDAYLFAVGDPAVYATIVDNDEALDWWPSYGLSDEFTFNSVGPEFANGELNPFSVPAVREAVNWLIDRDYIVNEIMGGLGAPRYTTVSTVDPDYVQYIDVISELEAYYAYNPDKAAEVIGAEMEALGATLVDDVWTYNDAPVNIIIVIRTEDKRREIGDYLATQLESIGFTVTRDYKKFSDAATCWRSADPNEGCFHIYTGGWSSTAISLDSGSNFGFWYTPLGGISVDSGNYTPTEAFMTAADALWNNQFTSLEERNELFETAIRESTKDSIRVWIVDQKTASPYSGDFVASGDLAGGLSGSALWAYTMRPAAGVGGAFNIAMPSILSNPWNPVQGSNALYDAALMRAVGERALVADPFTGHAIPMHVESATVTHQADLPIYVTKDWVTTDTAEEIEVPGDAWADWDAVEQRFITVEERFPEGTTALVKSTVVYPADLFETLKWHDGSAMSMGDFVISMILTFDLGKADSPYFEPVNGPQVEAFLSAFKGVKVVSTDPLTIEHYTDSWFTNAESNVATWWPEYGPVPAQAPWHVMALGLMSQEAGTLAFSADKALELEVEQMSWISGPSIEILAGNLATATAENFIPFAEVLGEYVTAEEATARYTNLTEWHRIRGHFWLGTGPYFLQRAFPVEGTVILEHNSAYPFAADRWAGYATPNFPSAVMDGPTEVTIGDEASYTVTVTEASGDAYAAENIARVVYLVFDAEGNLVQQGEAEGGENGQYTVAFDTSDLPEGSNRLQVIVVSKLVGVPVFVNQQFVTTQ
jgi:peptide/nickel transport system substrate-binding protein